MLTVNILARASELGKKVTPNKRFGELVLDEKKITLGELNALSKELETDGKTLLDGNTIEKLATIDFKEMQRVIDILREQTK